MISVSAIIPVFNNKQTLERAVRSVANDAIVSEVLIVDDGSSDGSLDLAYEIAGKYAGVRVLTHAHGQNKGAAASRNLGLTHAQSDWIQFLDADDELLPGKIESQIGFAKDDISFIVGNALDCFEDGRVHLRKFIENPWLGLISGKLGITSANLWNKRKLAEVGYWKESLESSQEYELMFRLLKEGGVVEFSDTPLTRVHRRFGSISTSIIIRKSRIENWIGLRKEIKFHLINHNIFSLKENYFYSGYTFMFCKENDCLEVFDGNKLVGTIFYLEKKIKSYLFRFIQAL